MQDPAPSPSPTDRLPVTTRRLSPTDISQYIRLQRCERFLRLRLHERGTKNGRQFLYEFGVAPQAIPPLLSRSGATFERRVEAALQTHFSSPPYQFHHFGEAAISGPKGQRQADNDRLIAVVEGLTPGECAVVCQPRLHVFLAGWEIRGDADLVRLERDEQGRLTALVTDIKSSTHVSVEHRLQVAFYQAMLETLLANAGIALALNRVETAILYRGPVEAGEAAADPVLAARLKAEKDAAQATFGVPDAYLERIADPDAYRAEVETLVTGAASDAVRIAGRPFEELFYALGLKCDGCLYNEFCMKDTHAQNDLSLVPLLSPRDKKALRAAGVRDVQTLARLKEFISDASYDLTPTLDSDAIVRRLAATTAGPRLDELVLRARQTRTIKAEGLRSLSWIPSKGHTTLPFSDETLHPNLVRVFIDAQHDYLQDRVYLIGALVVANENGVPVRRRHVVRLTDGPPDTAEKEAALFADWISETLQAVVELAAPDADGAGRAPIHLIFWNDFGQRVLLDALARNMTPMVQAAPALYDFVTQAAAFDSPIATFLDEEIRERKNYPMVCQSLQAVSAYLKFGWDESAFGGNDWRKKFYARLFDGGGRAEFARGEEGDPVEEIYARRSRHNSQLPLEYAYAAWGELEPAASGSATDLFAPYREVVPSDLLTFQAKRLDAIAHIADDFGGNRLSEKSSFALPDLSTFEDRAEHLARALDEFTTIERHVALSAWKTGRQLPPERRVLLGETLLLRYLEEDQPDDIAVQNRDNTLRKAIKDRYYAEYREANPQAKQVRLTAAQKAECDWSMAGMSFRLRVELQGVDADLDTVLGLLNLKEGDWFVLFPRWTSDERLPEAERTLFTPTPKQMLYGMRVVLNKLAIERDDAGHAVSAFANVEVCSGGGGGVAGYLFGAMDRPLEANAQYTLDPDPNDIYGYWQKKVCEALCGLEAAGNPDSHTLYRRVSQRDLLPPTDWPEVAADGQVRFLAGLDAFREAGLLHDFEAGKRNYIGAHGGDPILLVQGPPGTGKSYSTAFAVLARVQGALAAGIDQRVVLSCKTHSATDVLLRGIAEVADELERLKARRPDLWAAHFDDRLLTLPLLRIAGGDGLPGRVESLPKDNQRGKGEPKVWDDIAAHSHVIVASTPGGIYGMLNGKWTNKSLTGHLLCDLLVLDEASQMGLPEAMMASLPLTPGGRVVVVGDPRQMPPIVQHAWETEPRRTFQQFRSYESLFEALAALHPPFIRFEESFRLHTTMARFLRDEVYIHDNIDYHSRRTKVLEGWDGAADTDPFVAAVLAPDYALVVVVHDEEGSQNRNIFEESLIGPILRVLSTAPPRGYGFTARDGLGVVVPHRAQRAALQQSFPELCIIDQDTGEVLIQAVDTVERYQGDEREVILVSATESDSEYLQASAGFLLDPRRLTVALSRAKRKMVLIASRTIFNYFSSDEETFLRAQLWKNLLRRACTTRLWEGERGGQVVTVWGGDTCDPKNTSHGQ